MEVADLFFEVGDALFGGHAAAAAFFAAILRVKRGDAGH
jgi:hypothetical protein